MGSNEPAKRTKAQVNGRYEGAKSSSIVSPNGHYILLTLYCAIAGKWKEKELCREKMDRDYEEFIDSLPKLAANWDRDVKAPPRQKEAPPMKQAKKPKPRKQVPNKNAKAKEEKPLFEDVVFVTPPMTPEPIPSFVPVANVKKEPDDFWDFYDKGLPPV